MKTAVLILLLASPVFGQKYRVGQKAPGPLPPACGPANVSFEAHEQVNHPAPPQPGSGKAQVFFIRYDGQGGDDQHYTIKIGLDGAWAGAYKNSSWFVLPVEPGVHHVCASVQSETAVGDIFTLAHFTAEAGKTYYFSTRLPFYLDLTQPDSDWAEYLISEFPISTWKTKK